MGRLIVGYFYLDKATKFNLNLKTNQTLWQVDFMWPVYNMLSTKYILLEVED